MSMFSKYDIVVVGGGHAGCEAAAAAANLGSSVLLITMNMQTIAQMSCNPAMGGVAKGQIVREIDAMGGYSGIISDESRIQFRMLNKSKGPAMWSPRTQNDRMLFTQKWRSKLEQMPNLDFWQDMVSSLLIENEKVVGVETAMGLVVKCKSVILTNGTFLNGIIHIGEKQFGGGRAGERAATGITEQLVDLGFESGRMKTGTPPRLDGRTIDYSKTEEQKGDENPGAFSFVSTEKPARQISCHIGYTNPEVHEILKEGFDASPMFTGRIQGVGPRYCPSIEDKIERFAARDRHQLFIEPEGWDTVEIYLNGFSSSLPEEVQLRALRKIEGFANAKMFRPGYAIEYDFFMPIQLQMTLETKLISNLYFAGQINGTTGYEEAACQGMLAGINAHLQLKEKEPLILKRSEAYIGVLIDDLINKGTDEPYRMFTSRAEYRMLLRQDNADERLTPISNRLGLASDERMKAVEKKSDSVSQLLDFFKGESIGPAEINEVLEGRKSSPLKQKVKMESLIARPEVDIELLRSNVESVRNEVNGFSNDIVEQAEIQLKYQSYIAKEEENVEKMGRLENVEIHDVIDYSKIPALSSEAREKLMVVKPRTLGQAGRISGVSQSDLSVLMVYLGR